jgi:regulator of chromosome condensation
VHGISAAAGDCQSVLVDSEGRVWVWGCYKDKEGKPIRDAPSPAGVRGKNELPVKVPMPLADGAKPVQVACGASFNAARTSDGGVQTWGLGECGELARPAGPLKVGEDYDLACIARQHLKPAAPVFAGPSASRYVKTIGAGGYHLLVVTVSPAAGYQTWASGLNNYGQLGLGDHDNRKELTPVEAFRGMNMACVDGGMHHSMAVSAEGEL